MAKTTNANEQQLFDMIDALPEDKRHQLRITSVGVLLEGFIALGDWVSQTLPGEIGGRTAEMVVSKNLQALNFLGVTKDEINEANGRIADSPIDRVEFDG